MKKKSKELIEFGKLVRRHRHLLDLTQEKLSERIGCHTNHLSRIEGGHIDVSLSMIYRIARALKVSICEIMPHLPQKIQ